MKATMLDISAACGLSTATVDRALNNRPGVSAANRQRVLEAAQQLGYLPTMGAVTLPSRPAHLEFMLPIGGNAFMVDLADHLEDFCARLPLVSRCTIHDIEGTSPDHLQRAIDKLSETVHGVGVIALDHPKTRNIIREIVEGGVRVVTIVTDVPAAPRSAYVGIDNRVAGRTVAHLFGRFLQGKGRLALLTGSRVYRGHEEREMGFRSVFAEEFPDLVVSEVQEINDQPETSYRAASRMLEAKEPIDGIYCIGAGRSGVVRALSEAHKGRRPYFICHDLTKLTRGYLLNDQVDVVIDQNARLIAEQSVIQLLGSIAASAPFLTRKLIEPRIIFKENIPAM
jgi:LacI family transcriptional regulator